MKSKNMIWCLSAFFLFLVAVCPSAYSQSAITVTCVLTDDFALETDNGEIYEVDLDETAVKMFETGKGRLSVTGTVVESDLGPVFKVQSFKSLDE